MNRENNSMDELLVKYLLGEADAQEHLQLMRWREARQENERYFSQFKQIWETSKQLQQYSTVDESAAWERMKARLGKTAPPPPVKRKIALHFRDILKVAAVLVLAIGAYWFYDVQSHKIIVVESGLGTRTESLPDGSVVTLNKNATISYPRHFSGKTRELTLKGEAFFTISPDKEHPFIIKAEGVDVKVVGTSFNVKTGAEKTEVIVETGIVEVIRKETSVRLLPNEKATAESGEGKLVKDVAKDALYNYYRTNEFVCNHTPLWRLAEVLSEAYGTRVIVGNEAIKDLPLTATFKNENLDSILAVITETLNINVERRGADIILQ